MGKALLTSVVLAAVLIPAWAARERSPVRGLKRAVVGVLAFNAFYFLLVRFVLPRL